MRKRDDNNQTFTMLNTLFQMGHVVLATFNDFLITYSLGNAYIYKYTNFNEPMYFIELVPMTGLGSEVEMMRDIAVSHLKRTYPYGI
jgi:hypothetical protein